MRRIVVCANVSLDGVMQAPARADEDLRNGFGFLQRVAKAYRESFHAMAQWHS